MTEGMRGKEGDRRQETLEGRKVKGDMRGRVSQSRIGALDHAYLLANHVVG